MVSYKKIDALPALAIEQSSAPFYSPKPESMIETFGSHLDQYLRPLIYGAILEGPERGQAVSRHIVAFDTIHRITIQVPGHPGFFYTLKRSVPFTEEERLFMERFVASLPTDCTHQPGLCHLQICHGLEHAIASQVCPDHAPVLLAILQTYTQWAFETHEGKRSGHTIGICPGKGTPENVNFLDIRHNTALKHLGGTEGTLLALGNDGVILGVENLLPKQGMYKKNMDLLAPCNYADTALWTNSSGKIAVRLTKDGEILIFKNKALVFAKRRSLWRSFPHKRLLDAFVSTCDSQDEVECKLAVYQSVLDIAFLRSGGCISILDVRDSEQVLRRLVDPELILKAKKPAVFTQSLAKIINSRKFQKIPRKVRIGLCAMDGAVLLDRTGNCLAAGVIIRASGGAAYGGGRTAAARALGKSGFGIKISSDGYVEMYHGSCGIAHFA